MSWGIPQIILILLVVILLFGSKKLRNLGADLGSSIKSFKKSMTEEDEKKKDPSDNKQTLADKEEPR